MTTSAQPFRSGSILIIAVLLAFSLSCKKSSSSSSSSNPFLKGTVGGNVFTADTIAGIYFSSGQYYEVAGLQVINKDSLVLAVSWPYTDVVGTVYTLDNAAIGYTNPTSNFYAGPGVGHGVFTL